MDLFADLRSAMGAARRRPAASALAIGSLALAIGAVTAIFSVVYGSVLAPLPYRNPSRLVALETRNPFVNLIGYKSSPKDFLTWRARSDAFASLGAVAEDTFTLTGRGPAQNLWLGELSAGMLPALGVGPVFGRAFQSAAYNKDGPREVLLSYAYWRQDFGGSHSVLGQPLVLNHQPYTVVGVLPRHFSLLPDLSPKLWIPLPLSPADTGWRLEAIGRLKPGVPLARANAEIAAIEASLARQSRADIFRNITAFVRPLDDAVRGQSRPVLLLLLGAVALLLLIACANVANLLLTRASERRREMALRAALGAGRARLARQWLLESLLLALAAAALGLLLTWWTLGGLARLLEREIPPTAAIAIKWPVLLFALAAALATSLIFGIAPAAQMARAPLREALQQGSAALAGERQGARLRRIFTVAELTLALVLVIGGGLLFRSMLALQAVNPGFDARHLLVISVNLPAERYANPEQQAAFFDRALARLRRLPGVAAAAVAGGAPFEYEQVSNITIPGRPAPKGLTPVADNFSVGADYFRAMGIPLVRGRLFQAADFALKAPPVTLIDSKLAQEFWPGQDPLGYKLNGATIVGVVGHIRDMHLDKDSGPEYYRPARSGGAILIRASGPLAATAGAAQHAVAALDSEVPVGAALGMPQIMTRRLADRRARMLLLGAFAGLAVLLAALGVFGVVSYSVACRTHELGLRAALGARRAVLLRMVLGEGLRLAAAGVALGLLGAAALTRLLASWLYGVQPLDAATFLLAAFGLLVLAAAAAWFPARRAAAVDPMEALRYE
ncbi:MAG TPA: ADOP family duplicated permease [Terriglobales bacterium]|nr:ADOP family duplicated permease [Terriglobales bacterium]